MNREHTGGPAFPFEYHNQTSRHQPGFFNTGDLAPNSSQQFAGMTLRQYAAIHLKVPNSGDAWLDDMIRESLQNDFATFAARVSQHPLHRLCRGSHHNNNTSDGVAEMAYGYADAMLKAREE